MAWMFVIDKTPFVPGEDCIRCGGSRKEAKQYKTRCYSWGTWYKQHIWSWEHADEEQQ